MIMMMMTVMMMMMVIRAFSSAGAEAYPGRCLKIRQPPPKRVGTKKKRVPDVVRPLAIPFGVGVGVKEVLLLLVVLVGRGGRRVG